MERALKDFNEWAKTIAVIDYKYYATFDEHSGRLLGVYPEFETFDRLHSVEIEAAVAKSIFDGTSNLQSYYVDVQTAEFIEIKSLVKMDDVLHRIIDKKWSSTKEPDVLVTYDRNKTSIGISLAPKFSSLKNIHWNGATEMLYLITDYNDPNALRYNISVKIEELVGKNKVFENIILPEDFSVYTRRLFKNYVVEHI